MTFRTCEKLITAKKARLAGEEWTAFVQDMTNKMDVFLLADRSTDEQYNALLAMIE